MNEELKALEKRIMVVNDYKVRIEKYIDLPVYQNDKGEFVMKVEDDDE